MKQQGHCYMLQKDKIWLPITESCQKYMSLDQCHASRFMKSIVQTLDPPCECIRWIVHLFLGLINALALVLALITVYNSVRLLHFQICPLIYDNGIDLSTMSAIFLFYNPSSKAQQRHQNAVKFLSLVNLRYTQRHPHNLSLVQFFQNGMEMEQKCLSLVLIFPKLALLPSTDNTGGNIQMAFQMK